MIPLILLKVVKIIENESKDVARIKEREGKELVFNG